MRRKPPVCVRSRDGWCATRLKHARYRDSIKTACGHFVILPFGVERRLPDCKQCLQAMR
jgi:hypothetical protein